MFKHVTIWNMEYKYLEDRPSNDGLEQFMEVGSVLHKKGVGRPSIDANKVDRFHKAFWHSLGKSTCHASRELNTLC
jgi:hypothetical protein